MHRRAFVTGSLAALSFAACSRRPVPTATPATAADDRFAALAGLCAGVPPIAAAEYAARRDRARALLREAGRAALLLEAGDALRYFTGVAWGRSERPLLYVLPADGKPVLVVPAFERRTVRERLPDDDATVLDWQEHESPYAQLAGGLTPGPIAVDPWTRQFVVDGVRIACKADVTPATALLRALRSIKGPTELALLRRANEATKAALKAVSAHVSEDMSEAELAALVHQAQAAAGLTGTWALVLFGANASFPHGTRGERRLRRGDLILVDAGGALHDYQSDSSDRSRAISSTCVMSWCRFLAAGTACFGATRRGAPGQQKTSCLKGQVQISRSHRRGDGPAELGISSGVRTRVSSDARVFACQRPPPIRVSPSAARTHRPACVST